MKSNFLSINWKDAGKALLITVGSAIITGGYQLLQTGAALNWSNIKVVLIAGIGAGVTYLVKNFLTNSEDELLKTEK